MPELSSEKLAERLARGKSITGVVLLGTDSYLREMCRNQIIEAFVPEGAREWAVARFSGRGARWDEILERPDRSNARPAPGDRRGRRRIA